MSFRANKQASVRNAAIFAGVLLMAICLGFALRASDADGVAAEVIKPAGKSPNASCPSPANSDDPGTPAYKKCQAFGEVTGLQKLANGKRNPYKVRADGRIVAFGLDLGKPDKEERAFFTDAPETGPSVTDGVGWGDPSAKLSILKKLKHQRFKLVKQSIKVPLSRELGRSPIFTLKKPLKVKEGLFVAITTGNWMPALAHDPPVAEANKDQWLASRGSKHCGNAPAGATTEEAIAAQQDAIDHSKPQNKLGSIRSYACTYTAARLMYRAYFVPDGSGGGNGGGQGGGGQN